MIETMHYIHRSTQPSDVLRIWSPPLAVVGAGARRPPGARAALHSGQGGLRPHPQAAGRPIGAAGPGGGAKEPSPGGPAQGGGYETCALVVRCFG